MLLLSMYNCVMLKMRWYAQAAQSELNESREPPGLHTDGRMNERTITWPSKSYKYKILGVRSLANTSRARQFNPLNPPGVGWVRFV